MEIDKQDVDLIVEFHLDSHLGYVAVKSQPELISIQDLQRLIKYFEEHIAQLQENPDSESYTFVTYGLNFQVQDLAGEVHINPSNLLQKLPDDGEFTIRFMVNVGQTNVEASRTYVGGESVVKLANIHSFTSLLQAVLTKLGCSQ